MSTIYTIHVGLTDRDGNDLDHGTALQEICEACNAVGIQGATVLSGHGLWQGRYEPTLVVSIVDEIGKADGTPALAGAIRAVAVRLKQKLNQDAVLTVAQTAGCFAHLV